MSSLHNFNLFCRRKNFSIEKYLKAFPQSTYQQFFDFLISRDVQPPKEEEFLRFKHVVKEKIESPLEEIRQPRKSRKSRRTKNKVEDNDQILEDN